VRSCAIFNRRAPQVCQKTVYLQYSTRQDIGGGMLVADIPQAAAAGPVLLVKLDCANVSSTWWWAPA
jgi:hypothetical protein